MRLKDKVAIVTGATSGIGLSMCELMAKEGAKVIVTGKNIKQGNLLANKINGNFHCLDVTNEDEWSKLIAFTIQKFGKLDILINNAGITGLSLSKLQDCENVSLENWHKVHQVNLDGVFLGCKYAIQGMKDLYSHNSTITASIINISSRSGLVGMPELAAYASSKAAVRNHTKSVALYCASKGYKIRCNSIHPALVMTSMWEEIINQQSDPEAYLKKLARTAPLNQLAEPIDVAYAAIYLASEESRFVTGSEIIIDGGIQAGDANPLTLNTNLQ